MSKPFGCSLAFSLGKAIFNPPCSITNLAPTFPTKHSARPAIHSPPPILVAVPNNTGDAPMSSRCFRETYDTSCGILTAHSPWVIRRLTPPAAFVDPTCTLRRVPPRTPAAWRTDTSAQTASRVRARSGLLPLSSRSFGEYLHEYLACFWTEGEKSDQFLPDPVSLDSEA
jgi:hypothetical protein